MSDEKNNSALEFTQVDVENFFYIPPASDQAFSTNIIVLTASEKILVNKIFSTLKIVSPETLEGISSRLSDLERLAATIARFPSLYERQYITQEERTEYTLIGSLLQYRYGDRTLHLPSKAILGKGFLVAKFQAFSAMTKVARNSGFDSADILALREATLTLMYTLMAEDVYLTLLEDETIDADIRRDIAEALVILWEHRIDQTAADIAPVLDQIWTARDKIAPVFGTMVGTSELLLLSIEMDGQWREFISKRLGESDASSALEEFLFGLSFEQIRKIRHILRHQGISAVSREEVHNFVGQNNCMDSESDPRNFYLSYTVRRDDARARQRLGLEGPKKTLEDHFMRFVLERNREKNTHAG